MIEETQATETAEAVVEKATTKPKTTSRKAPAKRKTTAKKPVAKKAADKAEAAESAAKKLADRAQEISRKAFLASLGFYGKAFDQAQEQLSALQERVGQRRSKANDLYLELVKRGEKVEADAREAFGDFDFPSLKELSDRAALEAKLEKARERFAELRESFGFKTAA